MTFGSLRLGLSGSCVIASLRDFGRFGIGNG